VTGPTVVVVELTGVVVDDAEVDPDPQAVSATERTRTASAAGRLRWRRTETTALGATSSDRAGRVERSLTRRVGGVGSLFRRGMSHAEM
jgi:hypothetical protein